ncbi:THUMP domain-containing protein 1 [Trichechus manatus latirostris]|uniref:THUMP domain-containing protein 1 n=1 Tax=Trichechus manatus latirostris TaxID=127582 RepID=A0A2Y9QLD8_TRIMA|nr:THUMP domain-containing protein 1 [Trichechus manatus latirostris]XP_023584280.1 THUMP domain-containing protein 1 [Trichechus manatus latirostris]XP_023584281.1 THUMP domain-containing protein 1 [Trichechus manatus latirostris]
MSAPVQQPPQPADGKRKGKAQYVQAKRARRCDAGGPRQLEPGLQGILITCNMNERKCVEEAYSLLNEYGDDMYGPEKFTDKNQQPSGDEGEDDDVEAALKKEVDDIRAFTEMRLRRFQSVESGANNVVFIRTLGIEPEKLVHHILQDMYKTKKKKTRVILRMLPISGTCKAFIEDMKKYAETFLEPWFKAPNKGTFQIVYKSRNNSHMNREEVIKELAGVVGSLNSENKVDLTNPQYTVVVEIIKAVCCLSVVKDYMLFRKYNLQEVVKSAKDLSQLNPKQAAPVGNGREAKLESGDKSSQSDPAEGKCNQEEVPGNSEEVKQTKPMSETQVVNEGGSKPELGSQVPKEPKSNENDLA